MGAGNCALYSVYQSSASELMDCCDGEQRPQIENWPGYRSAYADRSGAVRVQAVIYPGSQ